MADWFKPAPRRAARGSPCERPFGAFSCGRSTGCSFPRQVGWLMGGLPIISAKGRAREASERRCRKRCHRRSCSSNKRTETSVSRRIWVCRRPTADSNGCHYGLEFGLHRLRDICERGIIDRLHGGDGIDGREQAMLVKADFVPSSYIRGGVNRRPEEIARYSIRSDRPFTSSLSCRTILVAFRTSISLRPAPIVEAIARNRVFISQ